MIEEVLREIGLTSYEIKVYSALLELGEATSGEILNKAGIYSGKIYQILDSLSRKGLVSIAIIGGVKRFRPADPRHIEEYLQEREEKIHKEKADYRVILPILLQKFNDKKTPIKIEIYTGIKGLKTALSKELYYAKKTSTLYVMGVINYDDYEKGVIDFFLNTMKPRREKIGHKIKKIYDINARTSKQLLEKNAEVRYLSWASLVSMNIIENLSIISIYSKEMVFITIENKDVADGFIKQFNNLWKIAKK